MDDSIPPPAIRLRSPLKSRLPAPPPEQGDLFATGDAGEEGYLKWKAETATLREAESHAPVLKQASLEAQGDDSGHALWQAEREQERRKFEERWAVPLGHRVRLVAADLRGRHELAAQLVDVGGEIHGVTMTSRRHHSQA